jgi:hypothetical protein
LDVEHQIDKQETVLRLQKGGKIISFGITLSDEKVSVQNNSMMHWVVEILVVVVCGTKWLKKNQQECFWLSRTWPESANPIDNPLETYMYIYSSAHPTSSNLDGYTSCRCSAGLCAASL